MKLKRLLVRIAEELNLDRDFKIKVKPFKRKLASISPKTWTIHLNTSCLDILTEVERKFIIAHELLHLKL